jgi:hypothetical protein
MMTEIISKSLWNETLGTLTIKYGFQRFLKSNFSQKKSDDIMDFVANQHGCGHLLLENMSIILMLHFYPLTAQLLYWLILPSNV